MRKAHVLAVVAGLLAAVLPSAWATSYRFTRVQVNGSPTWVNGINNKGDIAGEYATTALMTGEATSHGFIMMAGGRVITVDPPGSIMAGLVGINDKGTTVGWCATKDWAFRAFIRHPYGVVEYLPDPPNGAVEVWAEDINGAGDVIGYLMVPGQGGSYTEIPFIYRDGKYLLPDHPMAQSTRFLGTNDSGAIVGGWSRIGDDLSLHPFVHRNGHYNEIVCGPPHYFEPLDINNKGVLVGMALNYPWYGLVWANGQFSTLVYPGAQTTIAMGVNDLGTVVGIGTDLAGIGTVGFVATPMPEMNSRSRRPSRTRS